MQPRPSLTTLFIPLLLAGCGAVEPEPLILRTTPDNGATAVSLTVQPVLALGGGVEVNATPPKVVLYDITNGTAAATRVQVGATVEVKGSSLTYKPTAELIPLRRYVLEVRQGALSGGDFDLLDTSDKPQETLPWKMGWWGRPHASPEGVYQLRFSTLSHPRVTGAFQEAGRVHVHFSQPMDVATADGEIEILDATTYKAILLTRKVWSGKQRVYLYPAAPLQTNMIYTLKVGAKALGADKTYLDGNDNGKPGEASDAFCAKFTGFQKNIFSRLGATKGIACP